MSVIVIARREATKQSIAALPGRIIDQVPCHHFSAPFCQAIDIKDEAA